MILSRPKSSPVFSILHFQSQIDTVIYHVFLINVPFKSFKFHFLSRVSLFDNLILKRKEFVLVF
jgi:hypothetical protein